MANRYAPLAERFWAKVEKSDDCWLWVGTRKAPDGYGCIRLDDRQLLAHRVALELSGVDIPADMTVDHLCMNKGCVRPSHLEVVTRGENVRRWAATITHCPQGHEYTPDNTTVRRGKRNCRACHRDRASNRSAA